MAPGLAILAPFWGRKTAKKYEKLETDDPERQKFKLEECNIKNSSSSARSMTGSQSLGNLTARKNQPEKSQPNAKKKEATQEEISRLNNKIERLVNSMSMEKIELAESPDDECVVCCEARSVMQVAPCGHQCQCRICFVKNIQEAVAARNLPLRCLICNTKIMRVKNNSTLSDLPVHTMTPTATAASRFPKSISGYSLVKDSEDSNPGSNGRMHQSASSYSFSSGISSMSASSQGSNNSVRSNTSATSRQSVSSWFSIASLSNFQGEKFNGGKIVDSNVFSKPLRAHSMSSAGRARKQKSLKMSQSSTNLDLKERHDQIQAERQAISQRHQQIQLQLSQTARSNLAPNAKTSAWSASQSPNFPTRIQQESWKSNLSLPSTLPSAMTRSQSEILQPTKIQNYSRNKEENSNCSETSNEELEKSDQKIPKSSTTGDLAKILSQNGGGEFEDGSPNKLQGGVKVVMIPRRRMSANQLRRGFTRSPTADFTNEFLMTTILEEDSNSVKETSKSKNNDGCSTQNEE